MRHKSTSFILSVSNNVIGGIPDGASADLLLETRSDKAKTSPLWDCRWFKIFERLQYNRTESFICYDVGLFVKQDTGRQIHGGFPYSNIDPGFKHNA